MRSGLCGLTVETMSVVFVESSRRSEAKPPRQQGAPRQAGRRQAGSDPAGRSSSTPARGCPVGGAREGSEGSAPAPTAFPRPAISSPHAGSSPPRAEQKLPSRDAQRSSTVARASRAVAGCRLLQANISQRAVIHAALTAWPPPPPVARVCLLTASSQLTNQFLLLSSLLTYSVFSLGEE